MIYGFLLHMERIEGLSAYSYVTIHYVPLTCLRFIRNLPRNEKIGRIFHLEAHFPSKTAQILPRNEIIALFFHFGDTAHFQDTANGLDCAATVLFPP